MSRYTFKVYGMDCAEEISVLKKALSSYVNDTDQIHFDLLNGKLSIDVEATKAEQATLIKAIKKTGMNALLWDDYLNIATDKQSFWQQYKRLIFTVISGLFMIAGYVSHGLEHGFMNALVSKDFAATHAFPVEAMSFFIISIIAGGWFIAPKALHAIKRLHPDMNLLMLVAVIGAALIGQWFEAAAVVFLFSVALLLESWSVTRARNAVKALLSIAPDQAHFYCPNHQVVEDKPVAEVAVGATIIVRPGERVPLDAIVIKGETHINQAPITGESLPVLKQAGEPIYAGTINTEGVIECRVTKRAENTAFSHIIKRVEEAQANRSHSEQWVEKFARYYTPCMILIAILVAIIPPLFWGGSCLAWFYQALVILVIACPCALVISTPVSIVAALSTAAREGILIKGGNYLETPSDLSLIAFDKTGTITEGKPVVQTVLAVGDINENALLAIAGSLEAQSDHPLAQAISDLVATRQLTLPEAEQVRILKGKGIEGQIEGVDYWLGSHQLLHEKVTDQNELNKVHDQVLLLEDSGHSLLLLGVGDQICGLISVADNLRSNSQSVVQSIRESGIKAILLTGDNIGTANAIGEVCHFDGIYSELLPEDKVNQIAAFRNQGEVVAMVGDGINDAPALGASDLGIAMGVMGSDTAIETADVALMADDLNKIPWLIAHSKRTLRTIKQNISFALVLKLVVIGLAFAKLATLWMAIAADTGASLLVVTNSLRLLKAKKG